MIWLLLAAILLCSGAVAASETALFGLRRHVLQEYRRDPSPLRRQVHRLMLHPRNVLLTVLMANTLVNVAYFAVAYLALDGLAERWPKLAMIGNVVVVGCIILVGEVTPKALALSHPQVLAPAAAALISTLQLVLSPVIRLLNVALVDPIIRLVSPADAGDGEVDTDELRLLVDQAAREGVLNPRENEMLQGIVGLGEVGVRAVMTPRVDVQWIKLGADKSTIWESVRKSRRRKLPVCGRDLDDIKGVLYARDLFLNPHTPVRMLVRPAHFIPEQCNLMQLIREFHRRHFDLAIVVDEYGGTAGLISSDDVAGRIVGDVREGEDFPLGVGFEQIDENTYRVSGHLGVRVWADHFGIREIDRRVDTVAGLILTKLGRVPKVGDSIRLRNLTLTVETMRDYRIVQVILHRDHEPLPSKGFSP